jgi:hypothetical protein
MLDTLNGNEMGSFLPGLKKVGKFTSKYTSAIAKAFIPAGIVNAASAFDPTKKKALANAKKAASEILQPTPAAKKVVKPKAKLPIAPIAIAVAALGALVVFSKKR